MASLQGEKHRAFLEICMLRCLSEVHVPGCIMDNKHKELEIYVDLQGYDLVGVTETLWDGSHDWSTIMDRYRPFRKN